MRSRRFGYWLLVVSFCVGVPATARAAPDDDPIPLAIQKGAKHLQDLHKPRQGYPGGAHGMGKACLAGMAMLEAGVAEDDPAMKNVIKYVRDNALSQTQTYELSLTIMFLDRLGSKADDGFIQFLGIRLMAGQGQSGGWSYDCGYTISAQEEARLKALFTKDSRLTSKVDGDSKKEPAKIVPRNDLPVDPSRPDPKVNPVKKGAPAAKADEKPALHPEVARWAKLINQGGPQQDALGGIFGGDNSNTQFGILGLWCARKHGVPCDRFIELTGRRFRGSQGTSGGWGYTSAVGSPVNIDAGSSPAMTCAGLIGLAVAQGSAQQVLKNKPENAVPKKGQLEPLEDQSIKMGLKCLGSFITEAKGDPQGANNPGRKGRKRFQGDSLSKNLYFMWSLERVGVIYGLETIGNHDWYAWGSDVLLDLQNPDGSWDPSNTHGIDEDLNTSFALLFLCRANIAKDLSISLKGKVKDPGIAMLRGGGGPPLVAKNAEPKKEPLAKIDPKPDPVSAVKPPKTAVDDFDAEAARLSASLVDAVPASRSGVLVKLRDAKGSVHTEALARAASKLTGDAQREVRETLAKRLTRMTAATLKEMLKDVNREIRRGAAQACGLKEDKQYVPDLIKALGDTDMLVIEAARASLRSLSGKDLGSDSEVWQAWWKTQAK